MLEVIEKDPNYLDNLWFSDESHFTVDGHVNKQNWRIWGSEKPTEVIEKTANPMKVTVWSAVSKRGNYLLTTGYPHFFIINEVFFINNEKLHYLLF